jgi:hypothetical protein
VKSQPIIFVESGRDFRKQNHNDIIIENLHLLIKKKISDIIQHPPQIGA